MRGEIKRKVALVTLRTGERADGNDHVQHTVVQIEPHRRVDVLVRKRPCAPLGVGRDKIRAARAAAERVAIGFVKIVRRGTPCRRDKLLRGKTAARKQVLAHKALAAEEIIAVRLCRADIAVHLRAHREAEKAAVPIALPTDRRTDERGVRGHHVFLFLRKRAEAVGDLCVERGGDRRFRHKLRHMIAVGHRIALAVRILSFLAVKLLDQRIIIAGGLIVLSFFAAGGKCQEQQRCKQRG